MKRSHKKRKKPSALPKFNGDHGPNTKAAKAGTYIEEIKNDDGSNPNKMARRRKKDALSAFKLSMRQEQAGKAIRDAYARTEMLSSGAPLKEQVDASPKPDAVVASQVDAQSHLVFVMSAIPRAMRPVVEHVCWHNKTVDTLPGLVASHRANLKVALDLVANKLRY